MAIDSKLRGCDVLKVTTGDLVSGRRIRTRAVVVQRKTKRPAQFELLDAARASLRTWLERRGGTVDDYARLSRVDHTTHFSTRRYARLVEELVTAVGLCEENYGTHSLRRAKGSITYNATDNLRAVQTLPGHPRIGSTVRYLGTYVEDASTLDEGTEMSRSSPGAPAETSRLPSFPAAVLTVGRGGFRTIRLRDATAEKRTQCRRPHRTQAK